MPAAMKSLISSCSSHSNRALLGSLGGLWRRHATLRRAALAQGLLSVGFSAFWSTLAMLLHAQPFHLGSLLFAQWGWKAVTALATASALAALATRLWPAKRSAPSAAGQLSLGA